MIKEELKKEARKDVDSLNGIDLVSSTIIAIDKYGAYKLGRYDGYLAGAEPREKRIEELERKLKVETELNKRLGVAYREYEELTKEQDEHLEELEKDKAYTEGQLDEQIQATLKLQKENAELKEKLNFSTQYYQGEKAKDQLTKAKELLAKWVELFKPKGDNIPPTPIQVETEQFISEVGK